MENFSQQLRKVFFASAHEPRTGKKVCKAAKNFFKRLSLRDLHYQHSNDNVVFCDFEEKFKATADEIGNFTQEANYAGGVFLVGTLINTTPAFGDRDVIYAAYFNSEKQVYCTSFAAIPKGKKVAVVFGRKDDQYYVRIYRKKGWQEADFGNGKIYNCTIHKQLTVRQLKKQTLPEINFSKVSLDENQQMTAAEESWDGLKRTFVFYKGKLYLR